MPVFRTTGLMVGGACIGLMARHRLRCKVRGGAVVYVKLHMALPWCVWWNVMMQAVPISNFRYHKKTRRNVWD